MLVEDFLKSKESKDGACRRYISLGLHRQSSNEKVIYTNPSDAMQCVLDICVEMALDESNTKFRVLRSDEDDAVYVIVEIYLDDVQLAKFRRKLLEYPNIFYIKEIN